MSSHASLPLHARKRAGNPNQQSRTNGKGFQDGFGPGEIVGRRIGMLIGLLQERAALGSRPPSQAEIARALGLRYEQAKWIKRRAIAQGVVAVVGGKLLIVDQEMAS